MRIEAEKLRLYAVTDRVRARSAAELLAQVAAAIEGGAGVVQLREKELPYGEFLAEAREFVTFAKRQKLAAAAEEWLQKNPQKLQPRFDVIEIYAPDGVDTKKPDIRHWENAFTLD